MQSGVVHTPLKRMHLLKITVMDGDIMAMKMRERRSLSTPALRYV
jgi:hypothetical protein